MSSKESRLDKLEREIRHLEESPLYDYRQEHDYRVVFGEGDVDAKLMFIGEAPGEQEAKSGRPFVGRAGSVLDDLLSSVGLERTDVYITNVVKDRPPDNRDPHRDEVELYKPFLLEQIEIIGPEVIVTLGRFALEFVFEEFEIDESKPRISELHGKRLTANGPNGDLTIIPLYHPAVAFYNREQRDVLKDDFEMLSDYR